MVPKIAVVGAGYWGKNLVRNFHDLGVLYKVCDGDSTTLELLGKKYPKVELTDRYEEILLDPSVDGIVLATPAATHYKLAREALQCGKHVFVEKPLALKVEDGIALVSLASKLKRVLMVGHILQYHGAVNKLKEMIDGGELGKVQYIYSNRLNIGKIRTEENILWSFAPHDISVILMLLGEMPETLSSVGATYLQKGVADVTMTTMEFPSGVRAHIFVSWLHPFKEQKLVVVGDKQMAVFDDTTQEKLFLYQHEIKWLSRKPTVSKAQPKVVPIELDEPLKAECLHFIDCIRTGRRPKTDGTEGVRVLQVLNACQDSLDRKGAMVKLSASYEAHTEDATGSKSFVHETAFIDEGVEIGEGTRVWHFSHLLRGSRIGRGCRIGQNVVIGPNVTIGDGCKIQNNVSVYEGVTLEDHVFCGPSMVFTNVYNPRSEIPRMTELRPTLVKRGATLGANCTIICGNTIGEYAFVAAGAVVTKDVPDYALVMGNPARVVGWMCKCGTRLPPGDGRIVCEQCGATYIHHDGCMQPV